jgi:thiamine biosynthesis lipoprotein
VSCLTKSHHFTAMGGPCRIRINCAEEDAEALVQEAVAEVERLEARYSRYRPDSLVSRINAAAGTGEPIPIEAETAGLLHYADTLWKESGGLFDLTSGILRRAWDFGAGRAPAQSDLDALLPLIGWDKVEWSGESVLLPEEGMEIDLGGCVKEYACDSVANRLKAQGLESGLVDLAGDMVAIGTQLNGDPWQVGIRHPEEKQRAIARIPFADAALASSGDYERCLNLDGERMGHILSPKTGWPVQGLIAVSIVARQCLVAGSAATVAMLKPTSEGLAWLESLGLPWLAVDRDLHCHGTVLGD